MTRRLDQKTKSRGKSNKSKKNSDLLSLRVILEEWNKIFFGLLLQRQEIVKELHKVKFQQENLAPAILPLFPHFDHHREKRLFHQFADDLKELSLKELLAFSLIMESHASQGSKKVYPLWSERIHIKRNQIRGEIVEMINPFLLQATHQNLLRKVDLKKSFSALL